MSLEYRITNITLTEVTAGHCQISPRPFRMPGHGAAMMMMMVAGVPGPKACKPG